MSEQASTWMSLKHIVPANKSQTQKLHFFFNFIHMTFWKRKNYRDRKQIQSFQGLRVGETVFDRLAFLRGNDGTVLYCDCDNITPHTCQTQN